MGTQPFGDVRLSKAIWGRTFFGTILLTTMFVDPEGLLPVMLEYTDGSHTHPRSINESSPLGTQSGSVIYFNPDVNAVLTEFVDLYGNTDYKEINVPIEIELGHELIHALRAMKGIYMYETYAKSSFPYKGQMLSANFKVEELSTTGLNYGKPNTMPKSSYEWNITENALRKERGYGRRVKY